jgi:hypothetical protein
MELFSAIPDNITVVFILDDGEHIIADEYMKVRSLFELTDSNLFMELLIYLKMRTAARMHSTLAIFEDGAVCAYPNRGYRSVKETLR